jgi:hypothetical protein
MAMAQEPVEQVHRLNTIKLEFTQAIYPTSCVISYERVTKSHQSICISGGYEEFPNLADVSSTVHVKEDRIKSGFKIGGEYRFYMKKENRYLAPRGIYIGPYISYHDFHNERRVAVDISGISESADLEADLRILNLGIQLGYQFVVNHRWTFDMVVLGPSVSKYSASLKLDGQFTFDKAEVENEILLTMLDKFPMLDNLLTDKEVSEQGNYNSWSAGWRYQFLIGYQFGKKKK